MIGDKINENGQIINAIGLSTGYYVGLGGTIYAPDNKMSGYRVQNHQVVHFLLGTVAAEINPAGHLYRNGLPASISNICSSGSGSTNPNSGATLSGNSLVPENYTDRMQKNIRRSIDEATTPA